MLFHSFPRLYYRGLMKFRSVSPRFKIISPAAHDLPRLAESSRAQNYPASRKATPSLRGPLRALDFPSFVIFLKKTDYLRKKIF